MNAAALTKALGGRWSGRYGMCKCPAHDDRTPSLKIEDGTEAVLLHCFAGCQQGDIIDALRGRGLWPGRAERRNYVSAKRAHVHDSSDEAKHRECALKIWSKAGSAVGSPVEGYLRGRGITIPPPLSLRYHLGVKHGPTGLLLPCMIAAIQAPDRRTVAIHRTFIKDDGTGKAPVSSNKMALGPINDGAVRLGPAGPVLGIAEGIETGLSAMQLFDVPVWAALGSRMAQVEIPAEVIEVHIFADNGEPGHRAAEQAAKAFTAQGRRVFLRYPPDGCGDWNDHLKMKVAA